MASRFGVGATPWTWDGTTTTHWSATSNGAGGASVPTASDDVFLDSHSGAGTITISGVRSCKSLTCTGFTGTLDGTASPNLAPVGDVLLVAGMTLTAAVTFLLATAGAVTAHLTTGGKTIGNLTINPATGGTVQLLDNLAVSGTLTLTLNQSTFDANGKTVTAASVAMVGSNLGTLLMGGAAWTASGTGTVWDFSGATNLTLTPSTSTVAISDSSAATKTVKDNGRAYLSSLFSFSGAGTFAFDLGAAGSLTLTGALSLSASLELASGTFNAAGFAVTLASFKADAGAVGLTMGAVTWTLTGTGTVWDLSAAATMTLTPTGSLIKINDASAASKTFIGNSKTYNNLQLTGAGTGAFIIKGSNTFGTFTLDTPPHLLQFQDGTTNTATTWAVNGTSAAGDNILESLSGSGTWDMVCVAGLSASYVTLQGSHAHGGAFVASNSYDAGDNLFWSFVRSASTAVYFDSAYQYNGAAISTLTGLNWLWGETVGVLADGVDIGDGTVDTHGNLIMPDGLTHAAITVGKRYQSYGKTLRAPQAGNQDGSALGRKMAVKSVAADMLNSAGLYVGTPTAVRPIPPAWKQTNNGDLYTGMFNAPIDDRHDANGVIVFQTDRGYPCTVRAIEFGIESEP